MREQTLHYKNLQTKEHETIKQHNLEIVGWGFNFMVDTEMEAYKAAYIYRFSPNGVKIEYSVNLDVWLVTVFNEKAKDMGIDGAK